MIPAELDLDGVIWPRLEQSPSVELTPLHKPVYKTIDGERLEGIMWHHRGQCYLRIVNHTTGEYAWYQKP